jgi:hypothetical protein
MESSMMGELQILLSGIDSSDHLPAYIIQKIEENQQPTRAVM